MSEPSNTREDEKPFVPRQNEIKPIEKDKDKSKKKNTPHTYRQEGRDL